MLRGLTARLDPAAAAHNFSLLKKGFPCGAASAEPLERDVIAVVKADAYGHGAAVMARVFEDAGARMLAVAFTGEAIALREAGITAPILVLFDTTETDPFFIYSLTPVLHDVESAEAFNAASLVRDTSIGVHIKIDTGMGRMGLDNPVDLPKMLVHKGLRIEGLMSHFADADLADPAYTRHQLSLFHKALAQVQAAGYAPRCHIANSAAALAWPEASLDAIRPGLALYGVTPFADASHCPGQPGLLPVMSITAQVLAVRSIPKGGNVSYGRTFTASRATRAAVIAAGYAEGYPRALSNRADVLIRGQRAPVMGRVCMDLFMADVTDIEGVFPGDEVILLGRHSHSGEEITAWELADNAGTIPYEILLSLGSGARKVYAG